MNIYLACTVRGDRGAVAALREVADLLEAGGHTVLTRHLLADNVDAAEATLTERDVFARDMEWLAAADVLIADASGSSYGVGFEVGYVLGRADRTSQRVLLLYNRARQDVVSRLIVGTDHPRCTVHAYQRAEDLEPAITRFLAHEAMAIHDHSAERRSSEPFTVQITRIHHRALLPEYQTTEAAGFDLAAVEDIVIQPGRVSLIPTGLVIKVPLRMFLGIFARSSTPVKRGLMVANGVGVIDPDYCGPTDEIKIAVMNFTDEAVTVRAGDRIAQGILLESPRVEWIEAETAATSRGGFGSSG